MIATYPVAFIEAAFLGVAREMGLSTAIHLLSWDNITCKGRFPSLADDYIAWGPVMCSELEEYYGVQPDHVHECGVPHFDLHARPLDRVALGAALEALTLDPELPYLFFGMSSPVFAPNEIDIVEWLADAVCEGRFGADMQLLVVRTLKTCREAWPTRHGCHASTLLRNDPESVSTTQPSGRANSRGTWRGTMFPISARCCEAVPSR